MGIFLNHFDLNIERIKEVISFSLYENKKKCFHAILIVGSIFSFYFLFYKMILKTQTHDLMILHFDIFKLINGRDGYRRCNVLSMYSVSKPLTRHVTFITDGVQIENPLSSPLETPIGHTDTLVLSNLRQKWVSTLPYISGRSIST